MNNTLTKVLLQSKRNFLLVLLASICFSFMASYIISLDLFLGSNRFVWTAFKYVFPIMLFVNILTFYGLYLSYVHIISGLVQKPKKIYLLYGPLVASFISFISTFMLYLKSKSYMAPFFNGTLEGFGSAHQLAWDLNRNYLPKIFLLMFVLTFIIDLVFVLVKFKRDRPKLVCALVAAVLAFALLTSLSIAILYALQYIVTLIIGGGGVA